MTSFAQKIFHENGQPSHGYYQAGSVQNGLYYSYHKDDNSLCEIMVIRNGTPMEQRRACKSKIGNEYDSILELSWPPPDLPELLTKCPNPFDPQKKDIDPKFHDLPIKKYQISSHF